MNDKKGVREVGGGEEVTHLCHSSLPPLVLRLQDTGLCSFGATVPFPLPHLRITLSSPQLWNY